MYFRKIPTIRTRRQAIGTGVDVYLENDSKELERLCAGEDDGDIGAAEPFSRRYPWEHGFLVLSQNPKLIQRHLPRDFAPQRLRL